MNDYYYDKLLNIHTGGYQKNGHKSIHYHPYEPTSYHALTTLFTNYELKSSDRLVDFGCGKGRLNFYIHYYFHASVVGIEMNEVLYRIAVENQTNYMVKAKLTSETIQFHCCLAEEYEINPLDNRFYFFNPFSKEIFITILNKIMTSVDRAQREIELILYYGSEDYVSYIENNTSFKLKQEIKLPAYKKDRYERFLIYRLA